MVFCAVVEQMIHYITNIHLLIIRKPSHPTHFDFNFRLVDHMKKKTFTENEPEYPDQRVGVSSLALPGISPSALYKLCPSTKHITHSILEKPFVDYKC